MERLRERLHRRLADTIPGIVLNGSSDHHLPSTLNLSFPGVRGGDLLAKATGVCASTGSACHGEISLPSPVLRAMGAIRLSLGRFTTPDAIDRASVALIDSWRRLTS